MNDDAPIGRVEAFHSHLDTQVSDLRLTMVTQHAETQVALNKLASAYERLVDADENILRCMQKVSEAALKAPAPSNGQGKLIRWVVMAIIGALLTLLTFTTQALVGHLQGQERALNALVHELEQSRSGTPAQPPGGR